MTDRRESDPRGETLGEFRTPIHKLLVLDCCGVVLGEPMEPLFAAAAGLSGWSTADVRSLFRQIFRDALWTGTITVPSFWSEFADRLAIRVSAIPQLAAVVRKSLSIRIPAADLAGWRQRGVDITVLSNMRGEWIRPVLAESGHVEFVDRLLISNEIGLAKPSQSAYGLAVGARERSTMFMDDSRDNLLAMKSAFAGVHCELVRSRAEANRLMSAWIDE